MRSSFCILTSWGLLTDSVRPVQQGPQISKDVQPHAAHRRCDIHWCWKSQWMLDHLSIFSSFWLRINNVPRRQLIMWHFQIICCTNYNTWSICVSSRRWVNSTLMVLTHCCSLKSNTVFDMIFEPRGWLQPARILTAVAYANRCGTNRSSLFRPYNNNNVHYYYYMHIVVP